MEKLLDADVHHDTFVRASRERVYDAFATASGLDDWFTKGATVDARGGGEIVYRWKDWGPNKITTEAHGTVLQAERPSRFVFMWDSGDTLPSTVEINCEPADGGTIIRLRESGFQDTPRGRRCLVNEAGGWGEALTLVKFYLEHGLVY